MPQKPAFCCAQGMGGDKNFTQMCSGSKASSHLRLIDLNLGLRVIEKKEKKKGRSLLLLFGELHARGLKTSTFDVFQDIHL